MNTQNTPKSYKLSEEAINNITYLLDNIEIAKGTQNALKLTQLAQLMQQVQLIEEEKKKE